jgi:hypothetical protein
LRKDRFKKRDSDRSGFTYKERELTRDNGHLVGMDEYDAPPPSSKSLGGEGDVSVGDNHRADYTTYNPTRNERTIYYINSDDGISFVKQTYASGEDLGRGWMYVTGSATEIDIAADPQISAGAQGNHLTLECVGSAIILENSNGLAMMNGKTFCMESGDIITFIYNSGDTAWHETSRGSKYKTFGGL